MPTNMCNMLLPRLLLRVAPLVLALVLTLLLIPSVNGHAAVPPNPTADHQIAQRSGGISYRHGDCAVIATPDGTFPKPDFTYTWEDDDWWRFITVTVIHDRGITGTIRIWGNPGQGEPGGYHVSAISSNYPCDFQERLLASWTLTYLNHLHASTYFDVGDMEEYTDWLYDVIRVPGGGGYYP